MEILGFFLPVMPILQGIIRTVKDVFLLVGTPGIMQIISKSMT